ncbi:hypothetical protein GGR42_000835 [Saonia flava]|uniref:DUF998 domain-containing protein n=1 Tax=Saonia flava TaxID=523696 RepID=A0A846QVQ6_9FLAO|nr:hypothetical protein [Saonia flava]
MKVKLLPNNMDKLFILTPISGILLFVFLYIIAAVNYPNVFNESQTSLKFSLWNNYLCDLLDIYTINGQHNSSRSIAILALIILCSSIILLWSFLPIIFSTKSINRQIMSVTGIVSLTTTLFLPYGHHDFFVHVAGLFAVPALISCFLELYKIGHYRLLSFGVLCFLVFLINYYVYETEIFIGILPVIQKITFLLFIGWFVLLNLLLYKKI